MIEFYSLQRRANAKSSLLHMDAHRSQSICSSQKENYILSIDQALAKFRAQNLDYFDIFEREVTPSFKKAQPCGRCKVCIKVNKRVCDAKKRVYKHRSYDVKHIL